jgi:hypothetical protein
MKKNVINEISQMKFLFGYKPGKVLSEQNVPMEEDFSDMEDVMVDDFEDIDLGPEVAPAPTREREKTREKEKETDKPYRPSRPDRDPGRLPYTDPDTHPQGSDEDEIEYELEIDDVPRMEKPMGRRNRDMGMDRPMGRMRNMDMDRPMGGRNRNSDETEYEIEIDGDIEDLF